MARKRRRTLPGGRPGLVILLAAFLLPLSIERTATAEPSGREVKRLLKVVRLDRDPEAWAAAVRTLREEGGESEELLDRELRRLHRKYLSELKNLAGRIDSLGGEAEPADTAEAARKAWERASGAAREYIFDEERFPRAENVMVISEGWETAFKLGSEAERAFGIAERSLLRIGQRVGDLTPDTARELREEHERVSQAFRRIGRELGSEGPEPGIRGIAWTILTIAEGRFAEAARRFREVPAGRPRLVVFFAYSTAILGANDRLCEKVRRATRMGMRELNRYRMALGRTPLVLNAKLMRAARGHSEEMRRLNYFSHDSPIRERRTEGDRAKLEGYRGRVSENIYASSSVGAAISVWKKSGKHHRTMTLPGNVDAGISAEGPVTLVLGSGESGSPPVLVY